MTNTAAVFQAIRERFRDEVAIPNDLVVEHDNEPTQALTQKRYRLQLSIDEAPEMIHTGPAGLARYRKMGTAVVTLACPTGTGDGDILEIADLVEAAFLRVQIAALNLSFHPAPSLSGSLEQLDGRVERMMTIPFRVDYFG